MISAWDDYPIHQNAAPVLQPGSGDPNVYDRYFFHGYDAADGTIFVGALGTYPNRAIIDAALCVSHGGVQRSVFASGRLPGDRSDLRIGPISVQVVEPLERLRLTVDAPEQGLGAELDFVARTVPVQEPRQTMMDRARVVMDTCRFAQFGRWEGRLTSGDLDLEVTPEAFAGTRDRSWGVRPLSGATPAAPPTAVPGIWWMWAPVQLEDRCVHVAVGEEASGLRNLEGAAIIPDGGPIEHGAGARYDIRWVEGTRRAQVAEVTVDRLDDDPLALIMEPVGRVHMRGAGYTHLEWGHGTWHGEEAVGGEVLRHDDIDPTDFTALHVQQVCRVTTGDGDHGVGVLEQLAIGPHAPTALTGFADPA